MKGNSKRTIIIKDYDPKWKDEFLKIKAMLLPFIRDLIIDIIHIGSTSVEGLSAKPIIDFNIIIDSYDVFPLLKKELKKLEFEHEGDGGIKGRERFKRKIKDEFMDYYMYVCQKDSKELLRQIAFRDYLRKYNDAAGKYAQLKKELSEKYPHDIDSYIAGKHKFIESIIKKAKEEGLYGKL